MNHKKAKNAPAKENCYTPLAGSIYNSDANTEKSAETLPVCLLFKKHLCRAAYQCYRLAATKEEFCTLTTGIEALAEELPQFDESDIDAFQALCLALAEEFDIIGEEICCAV